ncbi:Hypothetical predicted protein [Pelobates cultripes]|uniref:Uncharacterized protein n=1 Tax=Pelobates cultripes TaxID=61616 RepID=A0AAD1S0H9_PELCU|nr:Hypothetical predicted protein [Pelobates cultripes]
MLNEVLKDDLGRYICVKGRVGDRTYTLANLYMPNRNQGQLLKSAMGTIRGFTEGCLIMGGNLNVTLDPSLDTSSGTPHHIINSIHTCLWEHRLIDCWRAKYLEDRDYIFFSIPNQTYSRLDYFLPHYFLTDLKKAHIGTAT